MHLPTPTPTNVAPTETPMTAPTAEIRPEEDNILELADIAFPDQRTIMLKRLRVPQDSWVLVYKVAESVQDPLLIYLGWVEAGDFNNVPLSIPQNTIEKPLDSGKVLILLFKDLGDNQYYEPHTDPQIQNSQGFPVAATSVIPDW